MLISSDGAVDLVHLLVGELILADNEPAQKEQDRRDDGDDGCYASARSILSIGNHLWHKGPHVTSGVCLSIVTPVPKCSCPDFCTKSPQRHAWR